jgi:hypothetical protein
VFLGLLGPLVCFLGGLVARSGRLVTRSLASIVPKRLIAKHALALAVEGPRVIPCHVSLPEISETFGQSGHVTLFLRW